MSWHKHNFACTYPHSSKHIYAITKHADQNYLQPCTWGTGTTTPNDYYSGRRRQVKVSALFWGFLIIFLLGPKAPSYGFGSGVIFFSFSYYSGRRRRVKVSALFFFSSSSSSSSSYYFFDVAIVIGPFGILRSMIGR